MGCVLQIRPEFERAVLGSVILFLLEAPLSLRGPLCQIKPCREGDLFFMDVFVALNLAPEDLCTLNEVRAVTGGSLKGCSGVLSDDC
jgi:hypothetical protein